MTDINDAPIHPDIWDGYVEAEDQTATTWGQKIDVGEGLKPSDSKIEELADGTHAFASAFGKGWHNLGTVLNRAASADELLVAAHADYPVFLTNSYALDDATGAYIEDANSRKTCRLNPVTGVQEILGNASPRYQPITNREAFVDLADNVLKIGQPNAATCGVLYGGRQAFMCWRLPREVTVAGPDDTVQLWLTACHSHDQSLPMTMMVTPLRTVCANVMRYNLKHSISQWKIRKTANAKARFAEAKEALGLTYEYADVWQTAMQALAATPISSRAYLSMLGAAFAPDQDASQAALTLWDEKRGLLVNHFNREAQRFGQTAWAALNAVDTYYNHDAKVNKKAAEKHGFTVDGMRQWRAVVADKSITDPRENMYKRLTALAGVN